MPDAAAAAAAPAATTPAATAAFRHPTCRRPAEAGVATAVRTTAPTAISAVNILNRFIQCLLRAAPVGLVMLRRPLVQGEPDERRVATKRHKPPGLGPGRQAGDQFILLIWCRLRDSNPRPRDYKSRALPAELSRRCRVVRHRERVASPCRSVRLARTVHRRFQHHFPLNSAWAFSSGHRRREPRHGGLARTRRGLSTASRFFASLPTRTSIARSAGEGSGATPAWP